MKNKILPFSVLIIFGIIFFIFYKGLQNSNIYAPDKNISSDIPSTNFKDFYSNIIFNSLNFFQDDKIYLLNIWSSWCLPCRQEHNFLMSLKKKKKIILIGLNYKDNKKNAENFLKELGNPYDKIFIDNDGIISIEWGAFGVPESYLISNNKIIKKFIGPLNQQYVDEINLLVR